MERNMKLKLLILASLLMISSQVNALLISNGDVFTVDWFVDGSSFVDDKGDAAPSNADLSATSTWTVSGFTTTSIVLDISISNTTSLFDGLEEAAITSFGFGVEPDATAIITTSGSVFDLIGVTNNQNFPGGFKEIDVCLFTDGCTGGDIKSGLQAGDSDILQITLSGTFGDTAELLFFPLKFQTTLGSYEPGGTTSVPEPSMVGLLAIGLLGMVVARRRMKV